MATTPGPWAEVFPNGRHIFYEDDDPETFVEQIKAECGFDPGADPLWGVFYPATPGCNDEFYSYQFCCPAEHLDAIYGRWPMGS
ncbi:hypothetical protein ACRU43_16350 [Mycobacterium colombiense]